MKYLVVEVKNWILSSGVENKPLPPFYFTLYFLQVITIPNHFSPPPSSNTVLISQSLSTTLTLNGTGNPNGQWIFQIRTTFATTAVTSKIVFLGGGQACNVYFIVGSSAFIGAYSTLLGNILVYTSIATGNGTSNKGTFGALHGAVTLIDDALTAQPSCTT